MQTLSKARIKILSANLYFVIDDTIPDNTFVFNGVKGQFSRWFVSIKSAITDGTIREEDHPMELSQDSYHNFKDEMMDFITEIEQNGTY